MKRYLLGYLVAWLVTLAVCWGLVFVALMNWMFSSSPLWFDVLLVLLTMLPFPAVGQLVNRKTKRRPPRWGLPILLAVMAATALLTACTGTSTAAAILTLPGQLLGGGIGLVLERFVRIDNYWEGALILTGHLLLPLLYQLGWRWSVK